VIDVIQELESFGVVVEVYDPWVSEDEVKKHYQLTMVQKTMNGQYQSVVIAVAHDSFLKDIDFKKLLNAGVFVYDIKGSLMDFVSHLENELGIKAKTTMKPMQPGDADMTYADISKIQSITGYTSHTDLSLGVRQFVKWFKDYHQHNTY
jgi:UDP-glucose 4-epimerase